MRNQKWYEVQFDIYKDRIEYNFFIDVLAYNAKEAAAAAKELWCQDRQEHMFHVNAQKVKFLVSANKFTVLKSRVYKR